MASKFHVSDDGIVRRCRAKTVESCRAKSALDSNEHFSTKQEAQEAYENHMNETSGTISESFSNSESSKNFEKFKNERIVAHGLTEIAEVPMEEFAPTPEIRDRMTNSDFKKMKEDYRSSLQHYLDIKDDEDIPNADKLEAFDEYKYRHSLVEDYKNETAHMLEKVSEELPEHSSKVPDYAEKLGYEESGSLEWLKMRQNTLGGSDVGAALAVGSWGETNFKRFREGKESVPTEDQVNIDNPAWRGNVWETTVLKSAEKVLGERIYMNKSTYSDGIRHANMDGLIPREDNSIRTVVEAKTSSHPEDWMNGIPEGYALQVQHYSDFFKSDDAYIAVNIDDETFKIYKVDQDYRVKAGEKTPEELGSTFTYSEARETAEKITQRSIQKRLSNEEKKNLPPKIKVRNSLQETEEIRNSWKNVAENGAVYVDLETTGQSPQRSHIIEAAFVKTDKDGNETGRLHKFYGIPEKHEKWNGTGPMDIHQITPDEIRGKETFYNSPELQKEIQDFIGDKTIVAHFAKFEKRFLSANGIKANYADTRDAFSIAVKDEGIPDNTLKSLVEWSGSEYKDAHRAINDTVMMKDSMKKLMPRIHEWLKND